MGKIKAFLNFRTLFPLNTHFILKDTMLWASQRSYFGSSCGYYYLFIIIIIVLLLLLLLTYWPGCSANTCGLIPPQDLCTCCLLLLGKLFAPLHTWLARLILASAQVDAPESLP